jgi:hypothetical protein
MSEWKGIRLKPCPFCGGEAEINLVFGNFTVCCSSCHCAIIPFPYSDAPLEASVKAWNRRENNELRNRTDNKYCGADMRETNATNEQREQLDLMRAKAQMNIKPIRKDLREMPSADAVEVVRCHKCIHWDEDTVRRNSNDATWWNEAVCRKYSDDMWDAWKDADCFCADGERIDNA